MRDARKIPMPGWGVCLLHAVRRAPIGADVNHARVTNARELHNSCITAFLHYYITTLLHYYITTLLHCFN